MIPFLFHRRDFRRISIVLIRVTAWVAPRIIIWAYHQHQRAILVQQPLVTQVLGITITRFLMVTICFDDILVPLITLPTSKAIPIEPSIFQHYLKAGVAVWITRIIRILHILNNHTIRTNHGNHIIHHHIIRVLINSNTFKAVIQALFHHFQRAHLHLRRRLSRKNEHLQELFRAHFCFLFDRIHFCTVVCVRYAAERLILFIECVSRSMYIYMFHIEDDVRHRTKCKVSVGKFMKRFTRIELTLETSRSFNRGSV